jgi:hypothetical protein
MNATQPTKDEVLAGLMAVKAVADTIKELGSVPSGHLYAALMGKLNFESYMHIIEILKGAGLVRETMAHELEWIA